MSKVREKVLRAVANNKHIVFKKIKNNDCPSLSEVYRLENNE